MNERELIYRYIPGVSWSKRAGAEVPIPSSETDDSVLAIKYVYWPDEKSDGGAFDSGGLIFEVCGWIKASNPEGEASWKVNFSRAIAASASINSLFSNNDVGLARGVRELFSREHAFDVRDFPAESAKETYLSIDAAKKGMSLFYGIESTFITVKIEH
ncbi:hypothetical protein PCAU_2008 [Pseudomonas chlororaphis subsp. aurantiaca]|uniref:hypothetical protein n=1 Tax=Pseudomonas chlororaphis TaxID=587753 RepID=UPI0008666F04|nr:hypothetical protein [Pseudomonas chlororaphis]BAV74217.1 hypothetical protein PCAU_2008 [Pseudomonas chlororaphis subsp. aurantiaca]